ncbi:sterol carrier family protein [Micropruina sp.]|uniref:sterol carrier family protein n=1 Tax=Micropruina sp. TaxID=2737536 RepID=UPI0039E46C84
MPSRPVRRVPQALNWTELDELAALDAPDAARLARAVRTLCARIAADHPGRTVELRVPPYAAIQLALDEGSTHRRGTPPNVVEIDGVTLLALATGRLSWADGRAEHRVRASGAHSDLSALFPLRPTEGQPGTS